MEQYTNNSCVEEQAVVLGLGEYLETRKPPENRKRQISNPVFTCDPECNDLRPVFKITQSDEGSEWGYADAVGTNIVGYDAIKIRQIFPVPDYLMVMMVDWDERDHVRMREFRTTHCPYLLADAEMNGLRMVIPVRICDGVLTPDLRAVIYNRRFCPECGKEMEVIADQRYYGSEEYQCKHCGHREKGWETYPEDAKIEELLTKRDAATTEKASVCREENGKQMYSELPGQNLGKSAKHDTELGE